ncbi:polymer-forming cytoskeletal protein [Salmonella enterica]|nr:polymer-forming cytoskeletal protein [Salmonella enterica]EHO4426047.1 polymer-forming cytoskeletal protein [Salmonella enterica]
MFSKKSRSEQEEHTPVPADDGSLSGERDSTTTVIGEGTVVEGNILQGKNADVYGELTGDITLPTGTVRVMQGGKVNGAVRAAGIVVGGEVEGGCEGQSVTVLAQGILRGTCRSGEFSIKPGGVFTGTSETLQESGVKSKTVTEHPVARRKNTGVIPELSDGPVSDSTQ